MSFWRRVGLMLGGSAASPSGNGSGGSSDPGATGVQRRAGVAVELRVEAGIATDPGCVRSVNEDALRVIRPTTPEGLAEHGVLAVVCDGMGGHEAGEVASALAMETIVQRFEEDDRPLPLALVRAIKAANRAVNDAARRSAKLRGMGTTCCALVLRRGAAYCAHVGDSRCYLIRDGDAFLMTEDHSEVMLLVRRGVISRDEARHHPDRNVISRALGSHDEVEVSAWEHPFAVHPDDAFLLCSDGLHDLVGDEELRDVVGAGDVHAQVACDRLVALARDRGGHDNISVAILRVRAQGGTPAKVRDTRVVGTAP